MIKDEKKLILRYSEFKLVLITAVLLYFIIFPLFLPANINLHNNLFFVVSILILWLAAAIIYFISHYFKRLEKFVFLKYANVITDILFLSALLSVLSGINGSYFFLYAFIIVGSVFYLDIMVIFTAGIISSLVIIGAYFIEFGLYSSFNSYLLLFFKIAFILLVTYFVYVFALSLKEILWQKRRIRKINYLNQRMLYNFSNELRAPLPVIRDFIGLLLSKKIGPINKEQSHILELLHQNASDLIEDSSTIVYFTQLKENELYIKKRKIDIIINLRGAIRRAATEALLRDIQLYFSPHHKSLEVRADKNKISSALYLVLSRAIQAADKKTRLVIKCQRSRYSHFLTIDYEYYGNKLPRIINGNRSMMGLYVAESIIKRHGGDIFLIDKDNNRRKVSIIFSAVE